MSQESKPGGARKFKFSILKEPEGFACIWHHPHPYEVGDFHVIDYAAFTEALKIIQSLKRGSCFCDVGIGNPMMSRHSSECDAASEFLRKHRGTD